MNKNLLIALTAINLVAVVGIVGLVVWVSLPGTPSAKEVVDEVINQPTGGEEDTTEPVGRVIEVSGDEFNFNPKVINAAAGETLVIEFANTGSMPHNFTMNVSGLLIGTTVIQPGETTNLVVDMPRGTNSVPFYCSIDDHRQQGMEGEFVIE